MKKLINNSIVPVFLLTSFLVFGCSSTPQVETSGEFFGNSLITAKCKTKLIDDRITGSHRIKVSTHDGVVYLLGYVNSDLEKKHAATLVSSVDGVKSVENSLIVRATN